MIRMDFLGNDTIPCNLIIFFKKKMTAKSDPNDTPLAGAGDPNPNPEPRGCPASSEKPPRMEDPPLLEASSSGQTLLQSKVRSSLPRGIKLLRVGTCLSAKDIKKRKEEEDMSHISLQLCHGSPYRRRDSPQSSYALEKLLAKKKERN